jgi:long-chain acyl-CoA synthetase
MEVRISEEKAGTGLGEIITRGMNVMLGYYKNDEATREVLEKDGWYHTGDLGVISEDGHLFIKGRKKNMLLGASGQNIYPEEIEDKLNSMAMVSESLIVQRDNRLVALVHPDYDGAGEMAVTTNDLKDVMENNREELNRQLPAYCKISAIEIHAEEFAKTPKKSIKRYLYK